MFELRGGVRDGSKEMWKGGIKPSEKSAGEMAEVESGVWRV